MDYAALKTYIMADPALSALQASGDYSGILNALNAKTVAGYGAVDRAKFAKWAAKTKMREVIQDVANTPNSPLRSYALSLLDVVLGGASDGVDFGDADNVAMLDEWENAVKLSPVNKAALLELATTYISIAQQQFGADITLTDLWEAFK